MARSQVSVAVAVVAVVVVVVAVGFVEAQVPDCASKLVPCADFLKSNNPPASCCDPIKEAVATQLQCLCNLYTTPGFLESIGVNVSDAIHLTKACGVLSNSPSAKVGLNCCFLLDSEGNFKFLSILIFFLLFHLVL